MSWGMNPEPLHQADSNVSALAGEARQASRSFLDAIMSAKGAVHHPKLVAALDSYHSTWSKPANQLPTDVEAVGNKIQTTASIGALSDQEVAGQIRAGGLGALLFGPLVNRPINVP